MNRLPPIIKLLRPHQWVKNLFLFLPIFFAGDFFNLAKLIDLGIGFVAFSLMSSAVYILNDYRDREADRVHPVKKWRPLASGDVKPATGIALMLIMSIIALIISWLLNPILSYILMGYGGLNIAYSMGLKQISILDILIVAVGFVLRTLAGGYVADVYISHWLIIMIFLLSLFLVITKRREDLIEFEASGKVLRKSLQKYNIAFINSVLTMLSGVIIVAYIMYSVSPEVNERLGTNNLYMTSIFVIIGLMRYLQITLVENIKGSPIRILYTDRFTIVNLLVWLLAFFLIIYEKVGF